MNKKLHSHFIFILIWSCLTTIVAYAQTGNIKGNVQDSKNQPVGFASVHLDGTQMGASTEDDGSYTIQNVPYGTYSLVVTIIGYKTFTESVTLNSPEVVVNIVLQSDYIGLNEVVVVGYGTKQIKDLTGSVSSVNSDQFLTGNNVTPEQLISGKVAGVTITSNNGAPGSGSTIRIRGGTSLNASNDPLIVIDGVPIDNNGISGSQNAMSLVNPNDIENITILKDASAAAIYGNRAANGVIIITTKKGVAGKDKLGIEFSTTNSLSTLTDQVEMMTPDQFRSIVDSLGNSTQKGLLGEANTNWQDEIYRNAFSTDNNLTFGGGIKHLPYRLSFGYLLQQGVLLRSQLDRYSATVNLNPTFLDNNLKVDVNFKFARTHNNFSTQGAIGTAVTFDPTQPVYSDTSTFGGYFEWLDPTGIPSALAPKNPLGQIEQRDDLSDVNRYIGNIQLDYTLPFFRALRANLNVGGDWSRSEGTVFVDSFAASSYTRKGVMTQYDEKKNNKLFEFYLNYLKDFKDAHSKVDLTAGYSYQDWFRSNPQDPFVNSEGIGFGYPDINQAGDTIAPGGLAVKTQNTLISFYGRLNYTFMDRYLLTATLRDDGSSRFNPDNRWGLFPSIALAWRISDENFLKNSKAVSNLKIRLGYGVTGQQDIFNDYPYIANYAQGDPTAEYQFGGQYYYVLRPDGYDANIKWEQTETWNAGLDFGFDNGRISGAIDVYKKNTYDLLSTIPVPAGSNFTNLILTNVGTMENKGVEFTLDVVPVDTKNVTWDIGGNVSYNHNEITNLSKVTDTSTVGILVGAIGGGVGNTVQIQAVGYPVYSFYTQQQLYDETGKPLEGQYADLNGDGKITPDDRYISSHHPAPNVTAALFSSFRYKNWVASFQFRGSWGNWMYNNIHSGNGWFNSIDGSRPYIFNLSTDFYRTGFIKAQYLSDTYLEDASFIKLDNISVGYNFKNLLSKKVGLTVSGVVQNLFTITNYTGLDPEIYGGIDNNIYPRPTIYSLNIDLKL